MPWVAETVTKEIVWAWPRGAVSLMMGCHASRSWSARSRAKLWSCEILEKTVHAQHCGLRPGIDAWSNDQDSGLISRAGLGTWASAMSLPRNSIRLYINYRNSDILDGGLSPTSPLVSTNGSHNCPSLDGVPHFYDGVWTEIAVLWGVSINVCQHF